VSDPSPRSRPSLRLPAVPDWRPDLRLSVVGPAIAVVVGMAFVSSDLVAGQMRQTAVASTRQNVEAIVRAYVDPAIDPQSVELGAQPDPRIDAQLERLIASGDIRRINIWSRDGRVVYSTDPSLRGKRFSIGEGLSTAFSGESVASYEAEDEQAEAGQEPPTGLVLEVYVPIRGAIDGNPFAVYEVYEDARPIEARVEGARRDVFLVALVASSVLLALLWLAFAASARLLGRQNRQLRERAAHEQLLTADLRRSEERFRSLVRNSSDGILIVGADGIVAYESGVERVLGHPAASLIGQPAFDLVHPDDVPWVERLFADVAAAPEAEASAEFRARHADGSWRFIEGVAKNLLDDPAIRGIVANYRDVTVRRSLEEQLRHQAFHDSLTGLPNRALFLDRLEQGLLRTRRGQPPLAVVFLDLDDFKAVNDSLGHAAGDELLVAVAGRITGALRESDTAARMGGDEFAILLEDAGTPDSARATAERVLGAIRSPFRLLDRDVAVRASAGIAMYASPEQSADELLRNADVSMYSAKTQGKDRLVIYEPSVHDATIGLLQLKTDLEFALARDEFALVYQPVIDLETDELRGVEALLRWRHPRRGLVGPAEFVPIAEETGLIVPIGRWVLEQACLQAVAWRRLRRGRDLEMSVNLSGRQIEHPGLVDDVRRALDSAGLEASALTLEITESVLMRDAEATIGALHRLREVGVRLAIDDFGTGYSSLSYLRRLPVDVLKIDRSFVAVVDDGADEAALVRSIVSLGRTLRLETVAEGIEQPGQLEELRSLGAGLGQGYLFARPLEPDDMSALLADGGPGVRAIGRPQEAS
jgi:diguanylate cyclase (GGDEF)-like protein/PAS domain S-box-containing protein